MRAHSQNHDLCRILACLLPLLLVGTAGCSHLTLHRDASHATPGETKVVHVKSFLWSFVPGQPPPTQDELCPQARIQTIEMEESPTDILFTVLTLGLYMPHQITVACTEKTSPPATSAPAPNSR